MCRIIREFDIASRLDVTAVMRPLLTFHGTPGSVFFRIDLVCRLRLHSRHLCAACGLGGACISHRLMPWPLYFFRFETSGTPGASEYGTECADRDAAWRECGSTVCAPTWLSHFPQAAENAGVAHGIAGQPSRPVSHSHRRRDVSKSRGAAVCNHRGGVRALPLPPPLHARTFDRKSHRLPDVRILAGG